MVTRFSGVDIPDDHPVLKLLQTVHLSVADELKGQGELQWSSSVDPPADKAAAVSQIKDGMRLMVSGFFQSWNGYMNGTMVSASDASATVTTSGDGVHVSETKNDTKVDEDFDKNMLLTQALVVSPKLRVLAVPTFTRTADGLIVSSIVSQVNQPPTAPQTEATITIDYAKADSFQIPSHLVFDIKNIGVFEIGLSACKVTVADWTKKP